MASVQEWGPAAWKFLHAITFAYPEAPSLAEQSAASSLFEALRPLLPCAACRAHYDAEVAAHPPDTRSRTTLSAWLVDLHNRVNARLGKPRFAYADAAAAYAAQCTIDCSGSGEGGARASAKRGGRARSTALENQGLIFLMVILAVVPILIIARRFRAGASSA